MNKFLTKIAEKKSESKGSWVLPAVSATIPAASYGVMRHYDLSTRSKFKPADAAMNKALMHQNKKLTLAVAGASAAATGIAEYSRRKYFAQQGQEQQKEIEKTIQKSIQKQAEDKQERKHDWKPAIVAGALDVPAGAAVTWAGEKVSNKMGIKGGTKGAIVTGLIGGVGSAAAVDYLQRRAEKQATLTKQGENRFLDKLASHAIKHVAGVGKHNKKPDSAFNKKELAMGRKVEHEHTSKYQAAEDIAKDHLSEIPDYYSRLKKMEDQGKKDKKSKK